MNGQYYFLTSLFILLIGCIHMKEPSDSSHSTLTFSDWRHLDVGTTGETLAIQNGQIALSDEIQLTVWNQKGSAIRIPSNERQPGWPRWASKTSLFWGMNRVSLVTNSVIPLMKMREALVFESDVPVVPGPSGRYQPVHVAWPADGSQVLVVAEWVGGGGKPARALLLDGQGAAQKVIWEAADLAPQAAWMAAEWMLLGTNPIYVFDRTGKLLQELPLAVPPIRFSVSEKTGRVLVVTHSSLQLYDSHTWKRITELPGTWLDAVLHPSGAFLFAIDFDGQLQAFRVGEELEPLPVQGTPSVSIRAIAIDQEQLAIIPEDQTGVLLATFQ